MLIDKPTQQALVSLGLEAFLTPLNTYLTLLWEANQKLNLVGRQQSTERLSQLHLLDCLLPWPEFGSYSSIADIGTGGGFPGICWAIVCPDTEFLLIEKSPKKCQFLTYVIQELKLGKRVQLVNSRVQDCSFAPQLIVSRAVTQTAPFLEITSALDKGQDLVWWLLKARRASIDAELTALDSRRWQWRIKPLLHPTQDVERHLLQIEKRRQGASA